MLNKELLLCGDVATMPYIIVGVSPDDGNLIGYVKMLLTPFGENHGVVAKYDDDENELIQLYNDVSKNSLVYVARVTALYCEIKRLDTQRTINLDLGFTNNFKGEVNPPLFSKGDVGKDIPIEIRVYSIAS